MQAETQNSPPAIQRLKLPSGDISPPVEFISIREIIQKILMHQRAIAVFVSLVTLAAGIFFFLSPKEFEAECYVQVIPPVTQDGRVDKEMFETMIVSYLQRASSAFILTNLSNNLNKQGMQIEPPELDKKITIKRPPKTDLIRVTATAPSMEQSLQLVDHWVREYLGSIKKNNIYLALTKVRSQLREAQSELMEKEATVERLRSKVAQTEPLITVSRAVDDRQLWSDLTGKALPDQEKLKRLSEIHIKGQEKNEDYINLKKALMESEQALAAVSAKRDLFFEVERLIETQTNMHEHDTRLNAQGLEDKRPPSVAERYLTMLVKGSEVVQFGEPGLVSTSKGVLKKTGLVFLSSMVLACFFAFMHAWWAASGKQV
jgi:hypothetical protein